MTQNQQPPKTRVSRAARNGTPQPPPANLHTLPRIQISPELATVLYYSRYPEYIPVGTTIPPAHTQAANAFASAAYQTLRHNPEEYTRDPPPPGYGFPPGLALEGVVSRPFEEVTTANTETEAGVTNGVIPDAVTGDVTTNGDDNNNNNNGGNAATSTSTLTVAGEQPTAAVTGDANGYGDDIYDDYDQPWEASPIVLHIDTGVTVSESNNAIVLSNNPAEVAGAVASAVMTAIEQASSARAGIPMIDESGAPRPLRVHVDASLRVTGSGNVVGPEALVREWLQSRTAGANCRGASSSQNLKRAREEGNDDGDDEMVWGACDDGESVGSKRSRSA